MSEIAQLCQHRWTDILQSFGVNPVALNGRNQPCPLCGGKNRYRFTNYQGNGTVVCSQCMQPEECVDGFEFLMRLTGKQFKEIAQEVRGVLGETRARPPQNSDVERHRARLRKVWADANPLSKGCPTHLYLLNRGLAGIEFGRLESLRCHPGLDYWHVEGNELPYKLGIFPAMIGLVTTTDGHPATLHCTYLTSEGKKASVDPVRKMMTPSRSFGGGAVRLATPASGQPLAVAEGIETALAIKLQHPDFCPWAVISAGNMEKFMPPDEVSSAIYIAADNDHSFVGQAAAFTLARKLSAKKHKASVLMPEKKGTDFNDQLIQQRAAS